MNTYEEHNVEDFIQSCKNVATGAINSSLMGNDSRRGTLAYMTAEALNVFNERVNEDQCFSEFQNSHLNITIKSAEENCPVEGYTANVHFEVSKNSYNPSL